MQRLFDTILSMKKLLWIDLEMTGLVVEHNMIIEVASIVTDYDMNELDTFHAVIKPDTFYLDQMDDWNKKTHNETGLLAAIHSVGKRPELVEESFLKFIVKNFKDERPIIAGNSVGHDRRFLNQYFKKVSEKLHYRTLDVTSWKIVFKDIHGLEYQKKGTHRALDDIRESVEELKYYMKFVNWPEGH